MDALSSDEPKIWPDAGDPKQVCVGFHEQRETALLTKCRRRNHQAEEAAAIPEETFAFLPDWFVHTWSISGWSGLWSKTLVEGLQDRNNSVQGRAPAVEVNATLAIADRSPWNLSRCLGYGAHSRFHSADQNTFLKQYPLLLLNS